MSVQAIPDRYGSITPYLLVPDAVAAIEFYERAFGAEEVGRLTMPDGSVSHAEIKLGDSVIMLFDRIAADENRMAGRGRVAIGDDPPLRRRRRRGVEPSRRGRRDADHADHKNVLGRPLRPARRPVPPPLVAGPTRRGRVVRGNAKTRERDVAQKQGN